MKHLYIYQNHTDITTQIQKDNINVSVCLNEDECHYKSDTFDAIVEYLMCNTSIGATTNNQCFDSGVYADDTIGIYCKATMNTSSADTYIFGNYYINPNRRYCWGRSSGGWYYGWGDYYPKSTSDRYQSTEAILKLNWLGDHKWYSGDDNTSYKSGTLETLGFTQPDTIKFLNCCKIYFFKISKGNEIIHDFIPVRKNGVGYFYDKITNKLYANRNSSVTVTYGPDVYDNEIEYIENTETCYIDTGIKGSGSQRVECEFMPIQKTTGYNCVYGARTTAGTKDDGIYIYSNNSNNNINKQYIAYNTQYTVNITSTININTKYKIIQDKGTFILDGNIIQTYTNATFTCPTATIFIFDGNNNGTRGNYNGYFRLYSFKIWNDDILVRNYIPVVKDNIGYLYDTVTNKLFGNAVTGNFVCGPILDYDYEIEYLESTGTQYIDTGIISQNNLIYDFYLEETQNNNQRRFFGFKEDTGSWLCPGMNDANWGSTFGIYVDFANTENKIAALTYPSRNGYYYFDFTDGAAKLLNNESQKWTSTSVGTYTGTRHVYIFSMDYRGQDQSDYRGIGRISYFKIIKNNILLFDGIPVVKNGIGYMYDKVTRKLFGNAGTGAFICGPQI